MRAIRTPLLVMAVVFGVGLLSAPALLDLNAKLLYSWGTYGTFPGAIWGVHQFSVDSAGNLYAAETFGGRTQKFRPKTGADPGRLIGAPAPLMTKR